MLYLKSFTFPTDGEEFDVIINVKEKCYSSFYPFKILSQRGIEKIDFEPVTIFYGSNGSGKTTALNVIAEKLKLERSSAYNKSSFFNDYVDLCGYTLKGTVIPANSRIITSDDVFDFMLNLRMLNEGIDTGREKLFEEYRKIKSGDNGKFRLRSLDDFEELKRLTSVRRNTQSMYVKKNVGVNVREQSNGESAFMYFAQKIEENALYLLDEPENSLSPQKQMELVRFLEDSARFYGCQFIIATHSPFVLSVKNAQIYDFDSCPAAVKRWTELENVRVYYNFFKQHRADFEK